MKIIEVYFFIGENCKPNYFLSLNDASNAQSKFNRKHNASLESVPVFTGFALFDEEKNQYFLLSSIEVK